MPKPRNSSRLLALGAIMLACVALPGYGQSPDCITAGANKTGADTAKPPASTCILGLHGNRAAVRLPAAGANIDDVAEVEDGRLSKWGYLDGDGELVIRPQFDQVERFSHELAAVKLDDSWGYIDKHGDWAIRPRFQFAGRFNDMGLALVREADRYKLIDRDGKVLKVFAAAVDSVLLSDGAPARVKLRYDLLLRSLGTDMPELGPDVTIHSAFGDEGLFIARNKDRYFGLVNGEGDWLVPPRYWFIRPLAEAGRFAVTRNADGVRVINSKGLFITGNKIAAAHPLGGNFVLVQKGEYDSFDPPEEQNVRFNLVGYDGHVIYKFFGAGIERLKRIGPFMAWRNETPAPDDGQVWMVAAPGTSQPVSIPGALQPHWPGHDSTVLLWRDPDSSTVAGIFTRSGQWLHDQAWTARVAQVQRVGGLAVFVDAAGRFVNALTASGQPLLEQAAITQLQEREIKLLSAVPAQLQQPVAIATLSTCDCDKQSGAGLLLADGRIITQAQWQSVRSLTMNSGGESMPQRFAVETAAGTGMINATGQWLLQPADVDIGIFAGGIATVRSNSGLHMIDRDGGLHPAPNYPRVAAVGAGLVRFKATDHSDAPWGLYNLVQEKVVMEPSFKSVATFRAGYAVAQAENDSFGVINASGQWVVPARYTGLVPVGSHLWQFGDEAAGGHAAGIVNANDQVVVQGVAIVDIRTLDSGRLYVEAKNPAGGERHFAWLFDANGELLLGGRHAMLTRLHGAWRVQHYPQVGYVASDGSWAIEPDAADGSTFHDVPDSRSRALRKRPGRSAIINVEGEVVVELDGQDWSWPSSSDWLVRHTTVDGAAQTVYADANGTVHLRVDGKADGFAGGYARLAVASGKRYRWLDKRGNFVGRSYAKLGRLVDGLALASVHGRYGYLDSSGRFVIPPAFMAVTPFANQRAVVATRKQSMIIDAQAAPLARVTWKCDVRVLYDASNRIVWPQQLPSECR